MTEEQWKKTASRLIKSELKRAGVTYEQLAQLLLATDIIETADSIQAKINRGTFPASFFFATMRVLGRSNVSLEDM